MEVEFDIENPLINFKDDDTTTTTTTYVSDLFNLESDHMVSEIYTQCLKSLDFNFSLRHETISLILQFSGSFDPYLSCLAVNYLDRFFSNQGMPLQPKPWAMRLLAIACISLASKMMKTEFSLSDFQFDEGFIFDTQTIERMEMLILGALKWRMRSITPFAFLQFFSTFFKLKDPPLTQALKARALEIIFKAQNEIELLEFKPSIVAASAILSASNELFPIQFPCFLKSISSCCYVNKEKLGGCINVMERIVRDGYGVTFQKKRGDSTPTWSSATAVNVLDHQWSSSVSASDQCNSIISSQVTTTNNTKISDHEDKEEESDDHQEENEERERKRQRKIGGSSNSNSNSNSSSLTFQLSQPQHC